MRRGHPGSGWRNDGSRHFRPRGGPSPMFRGPRNYGPQNMPRFPGPRFPGPPYGGRPNPFYDDNSPQPRGPFNNRNIFPRLQQMRQEPMADQANPYPDNPFYDGGDNLDDCRQGPRDGPPNMGRPLPWVNPPQAFFDYQNRSFNEKRKAPLLQPPIGHTGHRPPASDHYGSNPTAANDNSDTFSHSVDDTVNIVKKRLISRGESQNSCDNTSNASHDSENMPKNDTAKYEDPARQCSTPRRRLQRPRNEKSNCDQIKNSIVNQLFKMDKDRIHKLMDNPNSSSKFEYAISSLVTESQNSYNRHLRSMAEKSLSNSSPDFLQDNSTIYEDTFMKQMQCILDPQDTVFLEDLKPLVLAELNKVLQLGEFSQGLEDQAAYPARDPYHDQFPSNESFGNEYPFNAFTPVDDQSYYDQGSSHSSERHGNRDAGIEPLFERRQSRKSTESCHKKERRDRKYKSDERINEDHYETRTLSSDVGTRRNDRHWGGRTSHEDTVWGSKTSNSEQLYHRSRTPDDRFIANKTPIPEDRVAGSRIPVQDDRFNRKSVASTEDRFRGSKTPIPEDRYLGMNPPNPEIRFMGSKTPIPEDRFMASDRPREDNIYMGNIIPREDRYLDSKIPVTEDRLAGSKTPRAEDRFAVSKTPRPEDRFVGSKSPIPDSRLAVGNTPGLEDKFAGSNTPKPEDRLKGSKTPIPEDIKPPILDKKFEVSRSPKGNRTPVPEVFDANAGNLSDEDEAFAELDRQYHVAVDRNFISNYDLESPPDSFTRCSPEPPPKPKSPERKPPKPIHIKPPEIPTPIIDKDIDNQLLSLAKSPIKLITPVQVKKEPQQTTPTETPIKSELITPDALSISGETTPNNSEKSETKDNIDIKQESADQNTSPVSASSNPVNSRKRSTDQKPAHRKEKRKKSELESNKQILNKNIIINVNDCAKSSEKCDAPKSIFNLFFSKEKSGKDSVKDSKKNDKDSSDKSNDKHVKRKESKERDSIKKTREKESDEKKKQNLSQPVSLNSQTAAKEESKVKLKSFDMFEDCNKKTTIIRLSESKKKAPVPRPIIDNTKFGIGRKLYKRHVGTQVYRKILSKETQTPASKGCSCKDRKRQANMSVQTEPVSFKTATTTIDPFERMKEIDMEIQVLLQEKFTLYNAMGTKDTSSNTMQSLGMTVLNADAKDPKSQEDIDLEDSIVDDFTNIPVEELEQIALESVAKISPLKSKRQKTERKTIVSSSTIKSPIATRNKKKKEKTPNISLIEQIITDDRPLEDIISLDELEATPVPSKKATKKTQPKKKTQKPPANATNQKSSILKRMIDQVEYGIKDCCVVLKREDLSKYMKNIPTEQKKQKVNPIKLVKTPNASSQFEVATKSKSKKKNKDKEKDKVNNKDKQKDEVKNKVKEKTPEEPQFQEPESTVMEEVVNDIQFDMLDVSEDIVIGDDKPTGKLSDVSSTVCEEIILDNSQSSMEDVTVSTTESPENECKLYDFSADETLKRDAITVSGNADAVLAVECIDDNFIAACLDGNVYYFSGEGQLLSTLRGSNLAVTCLSIVREKHGTTVYTGSLDSRIRYYDLETGLEKGPEGNVLSPIQTMDRAWDTIFVGTRTGFVLQFECKNNMLIPVSTVKFSEQSILALRAMKEGPRKVLLVAARSEPVTVKDAQSGLLLRTLDGPKMTVYTLLFEDGKVYCGTSNHQIHVFDYVSGGHVGVHEGGKGAVCLRAAGGLVFAGCYDGCVYVYRDGQTSPLAQLRGPGLMLLSLAVIGSKIIAGYKDRSLYIWKMPVSILSEMIL